MKTGLYNQCVISSIRCTISRLRTKQRELEGNLVPKRKVGTESSECPATLVIMIMNDDVDENDGELGRFWTKIQSDNLKENVFFFH